MNGIQNRGKIEVGCFIQRLKKAVRGKGDLPVKSQALEWTSLLSKLLLREEPRCDWIQTALDNKGLCLKDMSSSNSMCVHREREKENHRTLVAFNHWLT